MNCYRIFYSPYYYADIGENHVFPIKKFELVRDRLLAEGTLQLSEIVEPPAAEIEDVLLAHPGVSECCVLGVPDLEWGETVAAVVVLAPGAAPSVEELRQWVTRSLRSSRAPAVIEFRSELPINDTGKVLRRVLKVELSAQIANA